ncbi:hypothetical protein GUJ93_ZPchr0003g18281 [Zizania palustris]|uniref:Uncharacterized protein n=1 Tax=Zizania palustris TaxID=103762 RepID=A0A8J5VWF4_ZIZPA|nr:hypothetical protein GUJ93_ZPchr0003g18281 [Zizania palustris]
MRVPYVILSFSSSSSISQTHPLSSPVTFVAVHRPRSRLAGSSSPALVARPESLPPVVCRLRSLGLVVIGCPSYPPRVTAPTASSCRLQSSMSPVVIPDCMEHACLPP